MLTQDQLALAIEVHQRAYSLLNWLNNAIREGFIPITRAHEYGSAGESARSWIGHHYENLPFDSRPEREWLPEFANYFGSYLETSFEFAEHPSPVWTSNCGCFCPMCRRLMDTRHLRTRTIRPEDKKRAVKLRLRRTQALALRLGIELPDAVLRSISSETHQRDAAFSAYGASMIERMQGLVEGPAVLVLWREIAWHNGSPNRMFRLRAKDFITAELNLADAIRFAADNSPS